MKKAKVVAHSLLVKVMHHMESRFREEHTMMKLRDMVLIANMYLLGLRGCDLYMINEDHVEFDFVERAVDIKLKGGKMTKKKVEHGRIIGEGHSVEYFEHMQHWVSFVRNKYSSGMLTEDKHGRKLFCNFDQKTLEVSDGRIETRTITKILRSRIKEYISESSEDLTEEQIDSFVSQFKSHSLKRSITTHAA